VENKNLKENEPRVDKTIQESLELYFNRLGEQKPHAVLEMVINAAEKPTIEFVLKKTKYNLSASSKVLGVTRATLRKKISKHKIFVRKSLNGK
jgi:Fis family transcriptional regulator